MHLNEKQIEGIRKLGIELKKTENFDIEKYAKLIKEESEILDMDSRILLKLITNPEFLKINIASQISDIDSELKLLNEKKYKLSSLICQLHGHVYEYEPFASDCMQLCIYCGEKHLLTGIEANEYLGKRNVLSKKFYTTEYAPEEE